VIKAIGCGKSAVSDCLRRARVAGHSRLRQIELLG
jgi:hypothetical protein